MTCQLLGLCLWLGLNYKPILEIERLPEDVAKQRLRLGHVGKVKLRPGVICWMACLCAIRLLVVKMGPSVFPQVRLFLHLVSSGTTARWLHKEELANRCIVRDTSLPR